jgi:SAM-dependent methyltransferase
MCHASCLKFVSKHLTKSRCHGKRILEVGSRNINGSPRSIVEPFAPSEYIGVDLIPSKEVDSICSVENLVSTFGENSFDIVISTELLEHVYNWKAAISNLKNVCKPNGFILLTTRSWGFPYHPCPEDHWRYSIDDFKFIFNDLFILDLISDPQTPGVFILAHKLLSYSENDLSNFSVSQVRG